MDVPTTNLSWKVISPDSGIDSLEIVDAGPPPPLGAHDCLVKIEAASVNFRDVLIPQGLYPFSLKDGVILGSDGAGVVISIGSKVTRFSIGDRVCTTLSQEHLDGPPTPELLQKGTGGTTDGVFRQYGVFDEQCLVQMPFGLSFREASTLPCAALTAWNALYGLKGRPLRAGDYVLTLGTGGVSLFALQIAVAAGAIVIATTSSTAKAQVLTDLGARHVVNYKTNPSWGSEVKGLTPGRVGVDFVVEVAGQATMRQSLASTKMDGIIAVVGIVGGSTKVRNDVPSFLDAWLSTCIVRGVAVGSRAQFEEMNRFVEATKIRPYLDPTAFNLKELREALHHVMQQKHIGKVVVDIQADSMTLQPLQLAR